MLKSIRRSFLICAIVALALVLSCSNINLVESVEEGVLISESKIDRSSPSWPIVKNGTVSIEAKAVQYFLKHRGYTITVDGNFGLGTETVVKSFQQANGLTADGIVGSGTWTKLIVTVKKGDNNNAVRALQDLLKTKFGYSVTVDGVFGAGTETIVKSFQTSRGLIADGIVGSTTWLHLIGGATSGTDFWGSRVSSWVFPVKGSVLDVNGGSRYFGANRDGGTRAHAGVDLVPVSGPGAEVVAMTSGTVLNYYLFYAGTYALEVKNDDGTIARYSEITSALRAGARVSKGQVIGTIIRNTSGGSYMLHLEVYMGTTTGGLTNRNNTTYKYVSYKNYERRSDLLDPMGVVKLPKL